MGILIRNPRQLLVLGLMLILITSGVIITLQVSAQTSQALDRDLEPVILTGSDVPLLVNKLVSTIFVYTYTGAGWSSQIPSQIDELTAGGVYTSNDNLIFDSEDELVFMADDLGDQAPASALATIPLETGFYEIAVVDPLDTNKRGWAYVGYSPTLAQNSTQDYIDYIASTRTISANQYALTFPDTFAGTEDLRLNNSNIDILDRLKLRIIGNASSLITQTVTENILDSGGPSLLKDGPVRVILEEEFDVLSTTLVSQYIGYGAALRGVAQLTLPDTSLFDITIISFQMTFDFNQAATSSNLYNANVPTGVTVDGIPDAGVDTALSHWFQLSHSTGRFIYVADSRPLASHPNTYYEDDDSTQGIDTGDGRSYGEIGYLATGQFNSSSVLPTMFYVLPPAPGGSIDNIGVYYEQYFFNPLVVSATQIGRPPITDYVYLPLILQNVINGKDLQVLSATVTEDGNNIQVIVANLGSVSTTNPFWVDLYINPTELPVYNKIWQEIAPNGVAWGVLQPMAPSEQLALTLDDRYFDIGESNFTALVPGTQIWVQADSVHRDTTVGNVVESQEDNNILGPITVLDSSQSTDETEANTSELQPSLDASGLPPR